MWTIWFDDMEVEGSSFEEWQACKGDGVVGIYVSHGRGDDGVMRGAVFSGCDWYWMMPDGTIYSNGESSDVDGVWVEADIPVDAVPKMGKLVPDERMIEFDNAVIELVVS